MHLHWDNYQPGEFVVELGPYSHGTVEIRVQASAGMRLAFLVAEAERLGKNLLAAAIQAREIERLNRPQKSQEGVALTAAEVVAD